MACGLVLLVFGIAGPAAAQKTKSGGGTCSASSTNIPVTSILNDTGSVADGTNYGVESDDVGSYYYNGVDSVSSILQETKQQCTGDWILDTLGSTTRAVLVDLRDPVPGGSTKPPFSAAEILPTRIIVKCHQAQSGGFPPMALNQTLSCPMFVHFTYAGATYRLVMSSGPSAAYDLPETNNAQVTCTAMSAGSCSAWTVNPIQQPNSGPIENIARLEQITNSKYINLGDFYVTFLITVTNP